MLYFIRSFWCNAFVLLSIGWEGFNPTGTWLPLFNCLLAALLCFREFKWWDVELVSDLDLMGWWEVRKHSKVMWLVAFLFVDFFVSVVLGAYGWAIASGAFFCGVLVDDYDTYWLDDKAWLAREQLRDIFDNGNGEG